MKGRSIEEKLHAINTYLLGSNCHDFCLKNFDGCKLILVGSFDLCYYHNIELVFYEVQKISMETSFSIDLLNAPFQLYKAQSLTEIFVLDAYGTRQSVICEDMDVSFETVKYYT